MNNQSDSQESKKHAADSNTSNQTLNKLRAAVLGANDGIVSTASVIMGVAGATADRTAILTAGLAALVAGAMSMAVGEYVSVSSQSDAEKAYIAREKQELADDPEGEFEELVQAYVDRGIKASTARKVAQELTANNALKAHLAMEFNLDEDDVVSPVHAAVASFISFTIGGLIPFLAMALAITAWRNWATVLSVTASLLITGYFSAKVGGASHRRAMARVLVGGWAAMAATYFVGQWFGTLGV